MLARRGIDDVDEQGRRIVDDDFFLVLDGSDVPLEFVLPRATDSTGRASDKEVWHLLVDKNDDHASETATHGQTTHLGPRALELFVHPTDKTNTPPPFSLR